MSDAVVNPCLHLEGITFTADNGARLLDSLSFTVESGETVAITGPNGAGKTTLIRIIAGLNAPSTGTLLLDGFPIHEINFAERARQIAFVGQSENTDGRLSVLQYVALGRLPHEGTFSRKANHVQIEKALTATGLTNLSNRPLARLSGGEKQKAKIARALCQQPKLLVLDEPTNHLDPYARGELLSLVAQMGITVISALHDLTLVDSFSDKTAIIADGNLIAFGDSKDVLSAERVQQVFRVDLHRLSHPHQDRLIPSLDIPIITSPKSPLTSNRKDNI